MVLGDEYGSYCKIVDTTPALIDSLSAQGGDLKALADRTANTNRLEALGQVAAFTY